MDGWIWLRGLAIGFSVAAPVGPIGVLVIRRTLADGWMAGLATGLGVATADALYGCIAGFGLTAAAGLLLSAQGWVRLLGGLFLCYLGIKTFMSTPADRPAGARASGLLAAYSSTLLLTLTNPLTIIAFGAVLAGLGVGTSGGGYGAAGLLVAGIFCGSTIWWLLLSGSTNLLRARVTPGALRWVNRGSGAVVLAFGVWALAGLV